MTAKSKSCCIACGAQNDKAALYCTDCGNYLPHDYFEVLGVERTADTATIRAAYIKLAVDCRPEKTRHLSQDLRELAERKLQQLNTIWDTLRDEQKRQAYIATLERQEHLADSGNWHAMASMLWRRGCARYIDYILFAAVLSIPVNALFGDLLAWPSADASISAYLFLATLLLGYGLLTVVLWVPIEAILLTSLGTTPGKWLYRLQVVNAEQTKLSFNTALARSLTVWQLGMGYGILLVTPFTNWQWRNRTQQGELATWDEQCKTSIVEQPLSTLRVVASSLIVVQSFTVAYFMLGPLPNGEDIAYAYSEPLSQETAAVPLEALKAESQQRPQTGMTTAAVREATESVPTRVALTHSVPAVSVETVEPTPAITVATPTETVPSLEPEVQAKTTDEVASSEAKAETGVVLPPSMRMPKESSQASADNGLATAKPALQIAAQTQQPNASTLSEEQRLACVQRYNDTMNEARELPLGDYARINQQAMQERQRCFSGN